MGYHVTILRTQGITALPIGVEEVEQAVAGRPEFHLTQDVDGQTIVEFPECGDPPSCVWQSEGEWWTKNPDEATIDAMCRLAALLDARVRGDEWETYRSSNDAYSHPDDAPLLEEAKRLSEKHRRKSRRTRLWVMGAALVLGVLAGKCSSRNPSVTGSITIGGLPAGAGFLQISQAHR